MLRVLSSSIAIVAFAAHATAQAPSSAEAETSEVADASAEARDLFRRGLALGEENRWADALEHFRRSDRLVSRASTRFNIGVALGRLGRFVEAIETWDALLAEHGDLPEASRAEAIRLRSEAVASLGEVTLSLEPPDAALFVDGLARATDAGAVRVVPLDPGRHVLRATRDAHEEATLEVSVVAGERVAHTLRLRPTPTAIPPLDAGLADTTTRHDAGLLDDPIFWVLAGTIVVVIGAGIGLGVGLSESTPPYGGSRGVILVSP